MAEASRKCWRLLIREIVNTTSPTFFKEHKTRNSPVNPEKNHKFDKWSQKRQNASPALSNYVSNETSPTYQVSSNWSDPRSTENVSESQCYHFKKTHILFYKLVLSHTENSMEWAKQHFSLCCSYFFFF